MYTDFIELKYEIKIHFIILTYIAPLSHLMLK